MKEKRRRGARRPPSAAKGEKGRDNAPPALEFLMKIVRGQAIDGRVPSLGQRIAAARQALPYFAPRYAPRPPPPPEGKKMVVRIVRFSDLPEDEQRAREG